CSTSCKTRPSMAMTRTGWSPQSSRAYEAVFLASRAVQTLNGQVDSARIVGYLARLIDAFAPYRRRPAVRQLTEQAAGLLSPR
ncbi:MAG: hypothetical protein ACRDTC_16000, partial [Pseudonocardiaceae bacterium]